MFDHLLKSSHRDDSNKWSNIGFDGLDSNKWSNIGFDEDIKHIDLIEAHFKHLIRSSASSSLLNFELELESVWGA